MTTDLPVNAPTGRVYTPTDLARSALAGWQGLEPERASVAAWKEAAARSGNYEAADEAAADLNEREAEAAAALAAAVTALLYPPTLTAALDAYGTARDALTRAALLDLRATALDTAKDAGVPPPVAMVLDASDEGSAALVPAALVWEGAETWRVMVGRDAQQDFANAWEADEYAMWLRDEEGLPARVVDPASLDAVSEAWRFGDDVQVAASWAGDVACLIDIENDDDGGLRVPLAAVAKLAPERWDGEHDGYGSCGVHGCGDCT